MTTVSTQVPKNRTGRPVGTLPPARQVSFWSLLRVETRKQIDTRGGRALLAMILLFVAVVTAWYAIDPPDGVIQFERMAVPPMQLLVMFVPVIALMAMTNEWTQRTALTTFSLAPRRLPVIAAKYLSAIGLTMAVVAVAIAIMAAGAWLTGTISGVGTDFAGFGTVVRGPVIIGLLTSIMAASIGSAIGQTAISIAVYFVLPTGFSMLAVAVLKSAAPWFDVFSAFERLSGSDPLGDLPKTLTSVTIWVLLPAVIGITRALRREVK